MCSSCLVQPHSVLPARREPESSWKDHLPEQGQGTDPTWWRQGTYIQLCEDTYAVEQTSWYATNSHTRMKFCVVSARCDPTVLDATSVQ